LSQKSNNIQLNLRGSMLEKYFDYKNTRLILNRGNSWCNNVF